MAERNDGGSAFPKLTGLDPSWYDDDARCNGNQPNYFHADTEGGLTVRDYFAIKFAAARVAAGCNLNSESDDLEAATAYRMADAMLKERAK